MHPLKKADFGVKTHFFQKNQKKILLTFGAYVGSPYICNVNKDEIITNTYR